MSYSLYLELETSAGDAADVQAAVVRSLRDRGVTLDDDGRADIETEDGGVAELAVRDRLVALDYVSLSPQLADLIYELAELGHRVFADNGSAFLTTSPDRVVPADPELGWPTVLCASPKEMHAALAGPFGEWVDYRDQVVSSTGLRRLIDRLLRR